MDRLVASSERWESATVLLAALVTGVLFGLAAQLLRQAERPLMELGAARGPWVTIGFVIAVWATRPSRCLRQANLIAAGTVAAYLLGWLISYHVLYAVRESVAIAVAWREAAPWLVLAGPACLVLGWVAASSHRSGILGDACLAAPLVWPLPELVDSAKDGWSTGAAVAMSAAALAALSIVAAGRRDVRPGTVVAAVMLLGGPAVVLSAIVLSGVHS